MTAAWNRLAELRRHLEEIRELERTLSAILDRSLDLKAALIEIADVAIDGAEIAEKLAAVGDVYDEAATALAITSALREIAEQEFATMAAETAVAS